MLFEGERRTCKSENALSGTVNSQGRVGDTEAGAGEAWSASLYLTNRRSWPDYRPNSALVGPCGLSAHVDLVALIITARLT